MTYGGTPSVIRLGSNSIFRIDISIFLLMSFKYRSVLMMMILINNNDHDFVKWTINENRGSFYHHIPRLLAHDSSRYHLRSSLLVRFHNYKLYSKHYIQEYVLGMLISIVPRVQLHSYAYNVQPVLSKSSNVLILGGQKRRYGSLYTVYLPLVVTKS